MKTGADSWQFGLLAALVASACLQGGQPVEPTTQEPEMPLLLPPKPEPWRISEGCGRDTCLADPDHPNTRYALETYGLHQVTHDFDGGFTAMEYGGGNIVAWLDADEDNQGVHTSDIYAYDIVTRELILVAVSEEQGALTPRASDGYIVHTGQRNQNAQTGGWQKYIVQFDTRDGSRRIVEHGLDGGDIVLWAFDYPWLVLTLGGPRGSDAGVWVLNLQDGAKHKVLDPTDRPTEPGQVAETLTGLTLFNQTVYYALADSDYQRVATSASLYAFDIPTQQRTRLYANGGNRNFVVLEASQDYVVFRDAWYRDSWITAYALANETAWRLHPWFDGERPGLWGEWAVFYTTRNNQAWVYNLSSGESKAVLSEDEAISPQWEDPVADGSRFYITANHEDGMPAGWAR